MFSPCLEDTPSFGGLCWEWQGSTLADRVALSVCFASAYLVLHAVAVMCATVWSKRWQLEKPIQTKFLPHEEHQDASLLYIYQHVCGGSLAKLAIFASALLSTPYLLPASYLQLHLIPSITNVLILTLAIDLVMYLVHYATHHYPLIKKWSGHHDHHKIISPTAETAVIGSLRESLLLAWLCPLMAMNLLPFCTFSDALLSMMVFQLHLTAVHHDHGFVFDEFLHSRLRMVTTKTHHVHHLRQCKNLGHIVLWWDMLGGTYMSWEEYQSTTATTTKSQSKNSAHS